MNKVLLISSANPYPVVTNGCERLVLDYQRTVFSGYDVHFVATDPETWAPVAWFHDESICRPCNVDRLLEVDFAFAFFVGFRSNNFSMCVATQMPAFCLTDTHPHPDIPDGVFRGILSHRVIMPREDILLCAGSYNSEIFQKNRTGEEWILSVGRIHPDKNQLELVSGYRNRIYARFGLPLYLVGGIDDQMYYESLYPFIDHVSVCSTIEDGRPEVGNWRSPDEIAGLLNRARFFVTASPKESFGIALAEALACGTTCVLNGDFWGFDPMDLAPHVFGNITGKRGSILDVLEEALTGDVRRDGSEWVKKYSILHAAERQLEFVERRLAKR